MRILIVGSGGREHAIAWKLAQSSRQPKLFAAPGNVGMMSLTTCVDIQVTDLEGLLNFALEQNIDLTVVGPEVPLVLGIVDLFQNSGLRIVGPNQKAAQFEGSKAFTKSFLEKYRIPTADYMTCQNYEQALDALDKFEYPLVLKADGLAAGKGVVIVESRDEAIETLKDIMTDRQFGDAGSQVVIESFLRGIEASVLCFCDGETLLPMEVAQDYKKAFDGDQGPNTGGMGAYCPSRIVDSRMMSIIDQRILEPFIKGIKTENIDFTGILFVGLMIDGEDIKVLEYNVRFGDPETEVVLPRLETDLIDVFEAMLTKKLSQIELQWRKQHTAAVVLASGGYPNKYESGIPIDGLNQVGDALVFHAGTLMKDGRIVTNGGRVICLTEMGDTHEQAVERAYAAVEKIRFNGMQYRNDIGS
jgi:phosphoribosylamine--glycine ligase